MPRSDRDGKKGSHELVEEEREKIEKEREEEDAPGPTASEQLQALSLAERNIDTVLSVRAGGSDLDGTGEGGTSAGDVPLVADKVDDEGQSPSPGGIDDDKDDACECFVAGLPPNTTDEDLFGYFSDLNPLSARVSRRKKGARECKGYGFVRFSSVADAERACERGGGRSRTTVSTSFFFLGVFKKSEKSLHQWRPRTLSRSFQLCVD